MSLIALCSCAHASSISQSQAAAPDWYNQPWTDSSTPYMEIRDSVTDRSPQTLQSLLAADRKVCYSVVSPSPLHVYRYCYTAWLYSQLPTSPYNDPPEAEARNLITSINEPSSYDYVRMRFLIDSQSGGGPDDYQAGKLLLLRNPRDYDVIRAFLNLLAPGRDAADTKLAFDLCKRLMQLKPNDLRTFKSVGTAYYVSSGWDHSAAEARYAITLFAKVQSLASPGDTFLPLAKDWTAEMKDAKY